MGVTTESAAAVREQARLKLHDFLLAEYGHMTESLLRNEESGEKRAAFFLGLAGAAGGVLAFAFGGDHPLVPRDHAPAAATARPATGSTP